MTDREINEARERIVETEVALGVALAAMLAEVEALREVIHRDRHERDA